MLKYLYPCLAPDGAQIFWDFSFSLGNQLESYSFDWIKTTAFSI